MSARRASAQKPIRVLQLRDSPWLDGPGRTILETAMHVDPKRIEYHVGALVPDGQRQHTFSDALQARGAIVHRVRDRAGFDRSLIAEIRRLVTDLRIDVLHSSEPRSNFFALLSSARHTAKLVATTHGWIATDLRQRALCTADKMLLRRFDAVIMVSHAMRRLLPKWWVPESRVKVLHNALVLESYGREALSAPRRLPASDGSIVLLNVGRLSLEKGQDLLLHAVATLVGEWPRLRLRFAGIGPEEGRLRKLAASLGLENHVEFLSYVGDMPSLYAHTDLLVQSSLTEGLPNVILEAAYLQVPIVATAVGGTGEVVQHEHSAWLVPPRSAEALAEGIGRFLADPTAFAVMARRAHESVRAHFSFTARTQRLTELYESLCR